MFNYFQEFKKDINKQNLIKYKNFKIKFLTYYRKFNN
jgi:hypothetical protein